MAARWCLPRLPVGIGLAPAAGNDTCCADHGPGLSRKPAKGRDSDRGCSEASALACSAATRAGCSAAAGGPGARRSTWHRPGKPVGGGAGALRGQLSGKQRHLLRVRPHHTGPSLAKSRSENGWVLAAGSSSAGKRPLCGKTLLQLFRGPDLLPQVTHTCKPPAPGTLVCLLGDTTKAGLLGDPRGNVKATSTAEGRKRVCVKQGLTGWERPGARAHSARP